MTRPAQTPVYDSRTRPKPYTLATVTISPQADATVEALDDPFFFTRIRTVFSWRDRIAILFGRPYNLQLTLEAPPDVLEAVLEMDANYRGAPGSQRRLDCERETYQALRRAAQSPPDSLRSPYEVARDGLDLAAEVESDVET